MVDNAFDLRLFKAKNHIDDAVGKRAQRPMPQQPMRQPMPQQGQMPQQPMPQQRQMPQQPMQQPMQQQNQFSVTPPQQGQMPTPQGQNQFSVKPQPFRKGGAAWTRKEGQNPEGGLNAKGRASLKAQGKDIKPPVSAKQAKKSPKAAARRKSFCARMSGMEGPMEDDKGRPTRKALSLRKWDC